LCWLNSSGQEFLDGDKLGLFKESAFCYHCP